MKVHCRTVLADAEFTEVATERKCAEGTHYICVHHFEFRAQCADM